MTTASFGGLEDIGGTDVFALQGYSFPGTESCAAGAEFTELSADGLAASNDGDIDRFEDAIRDQADFLNDTVEVGDWTLALTFVGRDIDDIREETFDLEKQADEDVSITLLLCLQSAEADVDSVDGVAQLASGQDCFNAAEGDLTFTLSDDDTGLRIQSDDLEMQFDDGDKAGDISIDVRMAGCAGIADAVEDLFLAAANQ